MTEATTGDAEGALKNKPAQQGLAQFFGRFATKNWWMEGMKLFVEVLIEELLKAFVNSFSGTVRYHIEQNRRGADISLGGPSQTTAGQVFTTGYSPREYTGPSRAVTPYQSQYQGQPFDGFPNG